MTDGLSSSPSFVSVLCMLGRNALPPTSAGVELAGRLVVPTSGTAAISTAAPVFPPISFSSCDVPAMRVFTSDGTAFATALLSVHAVVTSYDRPNFVGACLPIPSNLNLQQWEQICVIPEDHLTLNFTVWVSHGI